MLDSCNNSGFATELELVTSIQSCLRSVKNRSFRAELEIDAGVGVADIIVYNRNPGTTREIKLLSKVPPRLAALFSPETSKTINTEQDFALLMGLNQLAANRIIKSFEKLGVLSKKTSGIMLNPVKTPPFDKIISIEAKLSDWGRALTQAYRNRQFADESWVVLDHRFYKPAVAQLERFQRSEVSLASVDTTGNLFLHYVAPSTTPISPTKRWHAQAALARRVCAD